MFYHKNIVFLDRLPKTKWEYAQYISSTQSTFIPIFALNNHVPLPNGEFFSWLRLGSFSEGIKSKNVEILSRFMPVSSVVKRYYVITNGKIDVETNKRIYPTYVIHEHALFYYAEQNFDITAMVEPILLFTLATKNRKQTADQDFVLLVRKDVKDKNTYELFINKLIKWYSSQVEILYVDNIESYIYVDPQIMFDGLHNTVNISTLKEILFEQPQT